MSLAWYAHPVSLVDDRAGMLASARASMARNPVPDMTLPTPVTAEDRPRALTPNTVAPVTWLLSSSTAPESEMRNAVRGPTTVFPEIMIPGVSGPTEKPDLGSQRMSFPVSTASVTSCLTAMAVTLAQTWSALITVPVPPSTRMPIWPLSSAALFSITVPDPGATEPPDADAPVASGRPLMKYPSSALCSDTSPSSTVFWVAGLTMNPLPPLRDAELEMTDESTEKR